MRLQATWLLVVACLTSFAFGQAQALSEDGYYTKEELTKEYNKKYKNKLPVKSTFWTLQSVEFTDDGSVIANGVVSDEFFLMPKFIRIKVADNVLQQATANYCKKVNKKKSKVAKVRQITGIVRDSDGKIFKTAVLTPSLCKKDKKE